MGGAAGVQGEVTDFRVESYLSTGIHSDGENDGEGLIETLVPLQRVMNTGTKLQRAKYNNDICRPP